MIRRILSLCRRYLFATPVDALISLVILAVGLDGLRVIVIWATQAADWSSVQANLRFLMAGTEPAAGDRQLWLILASVGAFAVVSVTGCLGWLSQRRRPLRQAAIRCCVALVFVDAVLLMQIDLNLLGGLALSVLVTALASVLSLPLGVMLALGRRSRHAALRVICASYVELMRSLPLLLIIYMVWVAGPLVVPTYSSTDLFRGLAGLILFFCAYVSEYVRSGLQSVPKGQIDAARALGLNSLDMNIHIVFPQALKVVIPTLVGNVLDIFNATPLLFIIGLTDFLRAGQLILASPTYVGREMEIYGFLLIVYFSIGSVLTFAARRLEARGAKAPRLIAV